MNLSVKDIMQTNIITVSPDINLEILVNELERYGLMGAPVVEKGAVVGVVSRSDIMKLENIEQTYTAYAFDYYEAPVNLKSQKVARQNGSDIKSCQVKDIMKRTIFSVKPTQTLAEAADLMISKKVHRLLVIDEGKLVGILSATDFVKQFLSSPDQ